MSLYFDQIALEGEIFDSKSTLKSLLGNPMFGGEEKTSKVVLH